MELSYKYPNIEAERIRNNYSQEELAGILKIERKSYYNWLKNGKIPATVLISLADLYDCSIDYMLGRTRNPVVNQNS